MPKIWFVNIFSEIKCYPYPQLKAPFHCTRVGSPSRWDLCHALAIQRACPPFTAVGKPGDPKPQLLKLSEFQRPLGKNVGYFLFKSLDFIWLQSYSDEHNKTADKPHGFLVFFNIYSLNDLRCVPLLQLGKPHWRIWLQVFRFSQMFQFHSIKYQTL